MDAPARRRLGSWAAGGLLLVAFTGSGLVIGFVLGGQLGPRLFGYRGGHGLGDLGYLFWGAGLGMLAGLVAAAWGSSRRPPAWRVKAAVGALVMAALVAAGMALFVSVRGGW